MEQSAPLKIPLNSHLKLTPQTSDSLYDHQPYQRLLGKLIYLTVTRLDNTFAVHILSQFMYLPTTAHMEAAKQLLRLLHGFADQGLLSLLFYCAVTGLL